MSYALAAFIAGHIGAFALIGWRLKCDYDELQKKKRLHTFSVVTFNVLGKGYCRAEVFPHSTPEEIEFEYRIERMASKLQEMNADIFCMQEVDFTIPHLKQQNGYDFVLAKRSRKKKDGCFIAWKSQRYRKVRECVVDLNCLTMIGLESRRTVRDNIVLLVELEITQSLKPESSHPASLIIANTHLYYHPEYENLRLLQARYMLQNAEEFKSQSTYKSVNMILCGDFNSFPYGSVYNYIVQGRSEKKAQEAQQKLLVEGDLNKLAKWLRMLGLDVIYVRTNGKNDYQGVIDQARAEGRILATRNKRLTDRKDCTRYILIPSRMSHEEALKFIVNTMGIKISDDQFFSRCVMCNSKVQPLSHEAARQFDEEFPFDMEKDPEFDKIRFFSCSVCDKLLWWGPKSYFTFADLQKMLANTGDEEKQDDSEVALDPKEKLISESEVANHHSLNLHSSHFIFKGEEPQFTNFTTKFEGTLDYVFYTDQQDHMECVHSKTVPGKVDSPLPNVDWPSDHCAVKSTFRLTLH
jgi:mRNA deadenylase 3'-5' endonuclease subunit Ccr4